MFVITMSLSINETQRGKNKNEKYKKFNPVKKEVV